MCVVCVCSLFRDSITRRNNELYRYFGRMTEHKYPLELLRFSFVEGDSKDGTYHALNTWVNGPYSGNCILEKYDTGEVWVGSAVNPIRFRILAESANKVLDNALNKWGNEVDWFLWLESDIIIRNNLIGSLLESARKLDTKFVAPMVFIAPPDGRFYDIFAFIDYKRRKNFVNEFPYHPDYVADTPMRMWSVGSVMLMHRDIVMSDARWGNKQCIVDLCEAVNNNGFEIWLDPRISVIHP